MVNAFCCVTSVSCLFSAFFSKLSDRNSKQDGICTSLSFYTVGFHIPKTAVNKSTTLNVSEMFPTVCQDMPPNGYHSAALPFFFWLLKRTVEKWQEMIGENIGHGIRK